MDRIFVKYYIFLSLLALLASCVDDVNIGNTSSSNGKESVLNVSFFTEPLSYTRSDSGEESENDVPGDETINTDRNETSNVDINKISNIWFMEYDDSGTLIGSPKYYTTEDFLEGSVSIPIILPSSEDVEYKLIAVANTNSNILNAALGDVTSLAKLKSITRDVTKPEDTCNLTDVLMSSVIPLKSDTEEISCQLYRNIAKLSFSIENTANSNVKITSVVLCNVANIIYLADQLYQDDTSLVPSPDEAYFISYPMEYVEIDEGGRHVFEYYVPRNCRGTNSSSIESNKNTDAPLNATFFEINAIEKSTNTPIRYRFYPGANMKNDFNIEPNHLYSMPIKINSPGSSSTDNRVERFDKLELEESNAYIVNPINGANQQLHCVPINRINTFWSSVDGQKATNIAGATIDNVIHENTKWVAEVIWQDAPSRILDFCDSNGNILSGDTYNGAGMNYFYFKPRAGASGNVIIGVRKPDENRTDYLWSWHLWITDYNPNQLVDYGWQEGKYIYNVDGGEIHRYKGWETKYKDRYMMDRNLGAFDNKPLETLSTSDDRNIHCRGLFWQYGGMNPIPFASTNVYDINGNLLNKNDVFTTVTEPLSAIYKAIQNPCAIYKVDRTPNRQQEHMSNDYTDQVWYNPTWYTPVNGKTLFDPSPVGWQLVRDADVWDCFKGEYYDNLKGKGNVPNCDDDFSYVMTAQKEDDFAPRREEMKKKRGYYFYIGDNKTDKAWYPRVTYDYAQNLSSETHLTEGIYVYTSHSSTGELIFSFSFDYLTVTMGKTINYTRTFVLRCISQPKNQN